MVDNKLKLKQSLDISISLKTAVSMNWCTGHIDAPQYLFLRFHALSTLDGYTGGSGIVTCMNAGPEHRHEKSK